MENKEIAVLGTIIALELSKNKTKSEIKEIKLLLGQVLSTLATLYF